MSTRAPSKFRWSVAMAQPLLAGQLASQMKIPPLLAQCLLNRGFNEPALITDFLQPRLKQLADPFLLPDMPVAVDRLFRARERNESVAIFGDYDVDGVTSVALLLEVLRALGWRVDFYLPRRADEGYGLTREAVENCLKKLPSTLLLAVDCGSTSIDSINLLRSAGIDVIVLDHHQVSVPAPAALAFVNPQVTLKNRSPSSGVPLDAPSNQQMTEGSSDGEPQVINRAATQHADPAFTELCSVGLAFKLAHALVKRGREVQLPGAADLDLRPLLDLVGLGTIR